MISLEMPYPWYPNYEDAYSQALSSEAYDDLLKMLAETGGTTGPETTPSLVEITALNYRRSKRWHKTLDLPLEVKISLSHLESPVQWLVITEAWCGDAAHALPVMQAMARQQPLIDLRVVLRDQQPELIDAFLTGGTRSIPKLISMDLDQSALLGTWGPRPEALTRRVEEEKRLQGKLSPAFKEELQLWYNQNRGVDTARELLSLLPLE